MNGFLKEEKGDIKGLAISISVGVVTLFIAMLIYSSIVPTFLGSPVSNEILGNMTANETTFNTNAEYATGTHYNTFAVWNQTGFACTTGTALAACTGSNGPCYTAVFGTGSITINGTRGINAADMYVGNDNICMNYTSTPLGSGAQLTAGRGIATIFLSSIVLVGVMLIIAAAAGILKELGVI